MTLKDRTQIQERDALTLETGGTEAEKAVQWAIQSRKVVNGFERIVFPEVVGSSTWSVHNLSMGKRMLEKREWSEGNQRHRKEVRWHVAKCGC